VKTLRQLIEFRNIVPLLAIILAFLATVGIPQRWGFDTQRIILALLGVLALDTAVERLGYLRRIEDSIKSLGGIASRPTFLNRTMLDAEEPFTQFVSRGQDVLITGLSLLSTVGQLREFFKRTVQQGTNLRFLLLDPESPCLGSVAQFHGASPESLRTDIMSSLQHLQQLIDSVRDSKGGSIQVRLLTTIPGTSIVMRDGHRDIGVIRCELYLYQADVSQRPAFRLTPANGTDYHRRRDAAERLWEDSQPWEMR
jgi:hypothetical protein